MTKDALVPVTAMQETLSQLTEPELDSLETYLAASRAAEQAQRDAEARRQATGETALVSLLNTYSSREIAQALNAKPWKAAEHPVLTALITAKRRAIDAQQQVNDTITRELESIVDAVYCLVLEVPLKYETGVTFSAQRDMFRVNVTYKAVRDTSITSIRDILERLTGVQKYREVLTIKMDRVGEYLTGYQDKESDKCRGIIVTDIYLHLFVRQGKRKYTMDLCFGYPTERNHVIFQSLALPDAVREIEAKILVECFYRPGERNPKKKYMTFLDVIGYLRKIPEIISEDCQRGEQQAKTYLAQLQQK